MLARQCAAIPPERITVKYVNERNKDAYRHGLGRFPREFVLDSIGCIVGARRLTYYSDARLADYLAFGGDEHIVWYVFLYVDDPEITAFIDVANGIERLRAVLLNNATGNCSAVIEVLPRNWRYESKVAEESPSEAQGADNQRHAGQPTVRYLSKPGESKCASSSVGNRLSYSLKPSGQLGDDSVDVSAEELKRQLTQSRSHDRAKNILLEVDDPERTTFEQLRQAIARLTVAAASDAEDAGEVVIEVVERPDAPRTRSEDDPAAQLRRWRQFPDRDR